MDGGRLRRDAMRSMGRIFFAEKDGGREVPGCLGALPS
jgi:hypothetical protein